MNKKDLTDLGIAEDVAEKIIVLHGKDIEAKKSDIVAEKQRADGLQKQLDEAGKTIEGFKKLDPEALQKSADEWKLQAETAKADAEKQVAEYKRSTAAERFVESLKPKDQLSKSAILSEFMKKDFKLDDAGFQGANEWATTFKTENSAHFISESPLPEIVAKTNTNSVISDKVVSAAMAAAGLVVEGNK
jgi:hypothetical protein